VDAELNRRMRLFQETGQVSLEVSSFVRSELEQVADEWDLKLEEETAGMLVSHLLLALERARAGESINEWEGSEDVVEELAERPWALDKAREVVQAARTELGADLPETEVNFLALHLAAIAEVQGKNLEKGGVRSNGCEDTAWRRGQE
jgi:transcriptional regulatory protein LevR